MDMLELVDNVTDTGVGAKGGEHTSSIGGVTKSIVFGGFIFVSLWSSGGERSVKLSFSGICTSYHSITFFVTTRLRAVD